jgi:prophage maintenance system killer protein
LIWDEIGHLPPDGSIKFLSVDEIKEIHYELARDFERYSDPIIPVGVKSESLLASAAFRPNTSIGDSLKYPTIEMASAALIHSIIHNHPFHNGNKRTGLVSMIAMMDENGLIFECDEDELFRQVVRIAKHGITDFHPQDRDDREVLAIASWLNSKSRFIRKGDNPVPIRKLRNILSGFGCNIGDRQAGKILITRTIESSGRFRFRRNTNVSFILHSWTDGDEISPYDISKLRHELKLDEENAVDSTTFYDTGEITVDGFIRAYRKTLRRLSKM